MTRIAVIGAGAIGGWVAARLAGGGNSVSVLARGRTLSAIQEEGLTLSDNGTTSDFDVRASDDPRELGLQDILILAVKGPALPALARQLVPMIGPNTTIVPMLNGVPWWFMGDGVRIASVDPEGELVRAFPFSQILGCVVHAAASSPEPGRIELRMADRLILGEPGGGASKRASEIVDLLNASGLPGVVSDDVRREIWYKLWGNMTMNPISALTLATPTRFWTTRWLNS